MYSKGVTGLRPTADDRDTWPPTMQHIALKAAACARPAVTRRKDYPAEYELPQEVGPDTILMRRSCIIGPWGRCWLARSHEETILYADLIWPTRAAA